MGTLILRSFLVSLLLGGLAAALQPLDLPAPGGSPSGSLFPPALRPATCGGRCADCHLRRAWCADPVGELPGR